MIRAWRRAEGESGAAAVEFAIVCSLLMLLVLGIIQFGLTLSQWLQVEHAAREGARWASMQVDEAMVDARVTAAAAPLSLKQIVISPAGYRDATAVRQPVTVTVYYDSAIIAPLMGPFLHAAGVKELRSAATMMVE